MKRAAFLGRLVLPSLLALVVSCETPGSGRFLERDPEVLGRRTGRADALAGLSKDYERHLRELHPSADEDDFEDAYDEAFEAAEGEAERREEQRKEAHEYVAAGAYEQGFEAGGLDRHRGLSRNPDRHRGASVGSAGTRHRWIEGYENGWDEHER